MGRTVKGLEGVISEKGSNLSGGEIQRIGIARAMIYDPPIIFFDEATVLWILLQRERFKRN